MQYDRIFHEVNNFPQKMKHAQELKHKKCSKHWKVNIILVANQLSV